MKQLIDKLVAELDEETRRLGSTGILCLVGSPESRYLRGILTKAKKLRLDAMIIPPDTVKVDGFCVYDRETVNTVHRIVPWYDLDALNYGEMSCTASALSTILARHYENLEGKHVAIVGKGHAVKGLVDFLLASDCTVTICHSHTRDLFAASFSADILVIAVPTPKELSVAWCNKRLVLDVSGTLSPASEYIKSMGVKYVSAQDIGRLNISILLNRFARRSNA